MTVRTIVKRRSLKVVSEREKQKPCNWVEDSDGIWATACGNAFELDPTDGPPAAQGLKFCCYCGKELAGFSYKESDDDEAIDEYIDAQERSRDDL